MNLVLYQPDIPHNLGSIMRLCVCFEVTLHVIEPCAFPLDDKKIRLKSLDYGEKIELVRHASWEAFEAARQRAGGRLILATTRGAVSLYEASFRPDDWLLFGRESAGVPDEVHRSADQAVKIPLGPSARSFNVAMSAAIILFEALRQVRSV